MPSYVAPLVIAMAITQVLLFSCTGISRFFFSDRVAWRRGSCRPLLSVRSVVMSAAFFMGFPFLLLLQVMVAGSESSDLLYRTFWMMPGAVVLVVWLYVRKSVKSSRQ